MTYGKVDIGNVRGIKGDKGEKGERGYTPSYDEIRYKTYQGEYVKETSDYGISIVYYVDTEGNYCTEDGYLLDENGDATETKSEHPFDYDEYGYEYRPIYHDTQGRWTTETGELLDENGNYIYQQSDFISDVTKYIYRDTEGYNKIIQDLFPHIVATLINADPSSDEYKAFFDAIEGDIKYYLCEDDPRISIYIDETTNELVNNCKYYDDNGQIATENGEPLPVPLEKNALYLYNNHNVCDNTIMHYSIYLCTYAGTVPIKLVDSNEFITDYNVIDSFRLCSRIPTGAEEDEREVYLDLLTRGTRGQFYSISDVDNLFIDNVISKLGVSNGIAQLDNSGKIPSSQLPSYVDDIIEGTMNSAETVFTPSDNNYVGSVTETGKIYLDTTTKKIYRYSGSVYVQITNPVDSGWVNLTVDSNFYNYTENNETILPLQYRKVGNVVQVIGLVGLNANLTNGLWTIATLPADFRPAKEMSFLSELHNNSNLWTCIIKPNGNITFNRLRDINSSIEVTVTKTDNSTETVNLAKATTYVTGKQGVDVLKVNAVFLVG